MKKRVLIVLIFILIISTVSLYNFERSDFYTLKEKYTWDRPDYKYWGKINMPSGAIIVSNVPHIAKFYSGRVDYFLGDNAYEVSKMDSSKELRSGTPILGASSDLSIITNNCSYIFADYRSKYMWSDQIKKVINSDFSKVDSSYKTEIYASKSC